MEVVGARIYQPHMVLARAWVWMWMWMWVCIVIVDTGMGINGLLSVCTSNPDRVGENYRLMLRYSRIVYEERKAVSGYTKSSLI